MSKIIITDSNAFESEIREFEDSLKNIKDIFISEKNNSERINKTETWTSISQEVIYQKKKEFQNNFGPIEEALELYINFLKKTLDDYKRFETVTNNSIEDGLNNLNVN